MATPRICVEPIFFTELRSMYQDLASALKNRAEEGFKQAECVILDLSSHFHTWNYHRLLHHFRENSIEGISERPIPAIQDTCILFSPDNALDLNQAAFNPKALWGYLPRRLENGETRRAEVQRE